VSADPEASRDGIRAASAGSARHGIGRLQLAAWRHALAHATSIAAVVDVVQRIVCARRAQPPPAESSWQPRQIRSREDIEHWALRLGSRPGSGAGDAALVELAALMRTAIERMNELGPRRIAGMRPE